LFKRVRDNHKAIAVSRVKKVVAKYGPKAVGLGLNALAAVAPEKAAAKALDVFCTPRAGRVKSYQKKFLKKFGHSKVVQCNGHDVMTYHTTGSGPTVLLCHGWESNTFRWRKLYKTLTAAGYDVVAMDAPAHGNTSGEKFTAVLYGELIAAVAKEYEPAIICGHSVGGMATIIALSHYSLPTVTKAVILASPDRLEDITNNYFNIIGGSHRLRQAYDRLIEKTFGHPTNHYSAAAFASKLSMPALIIHDSGDSINRYEEGQRIHTAWRGSELRSTEGLGHSLQAPEVYQWIADFCAEDGEDLTTI